MTFIRPSRIFPIGIATGALALAAMPVSAVNIPEGGAVTPDSVFAINFQVQEGCDGAPTDALEVTIPDSVDNPLPEDVPNWDVEVLTTTETGDSGDADGEQTIVRWSGGLLEEGAFLEFGLRARFPDDAGARIVFPVTQRCGDIERVFTADDDENPAPTVTLTERFGPRDIADLSDTVAGLRAELDELSAQLGNIDAPNLRSRVSANEDAVQDLDQRMSDAEERLAALEEGSSE